MSNHLYDNQIEVLEAMGVETSWGGRDWIDGFHREDLHALSMAILHAQSSRVVWQSRVAGDPFKRDFMRYCKDLLVEPVTSLRRPSTQVHPSYFTYRPGLDYLTERVLHFFKEHLEEAARIPSLIAKISVGDQCFFMKDSDKHVCLCRIPTTYDYEDATRIKAELLRTIYKINDERADYHRGRRQLYYEAMKYVDALFGSEPLS